MPNPSDDWTEADWSAAMTAYEKLLAAATVEESRAIIGAAVADSRARRSALADRLSGSGTGPKPGLPPKRWAAIKQCPSCWGTRLVCTIDQSYQPVPGSRETSDEAFDRVTVTGCADCGAQIDAKAEGKMPITNVLRCNGLCVRNRDRGYLDPYDITVGDRIIEPDPRCPVHATTGEAP